MADDRLQALAPTDERAAPTGELIREALDETRELVRLEVALAREEMRSELAQAKVSAVALAGAAAATLISLTLFLVSVALSFPTMWLAALLIAAVLFCLAAGLWFAGWRALPKEPLADARHRIKTDLKQLKERIA
jgi:hypothetical protein